MKVKVTYLPKAQRKLLAERFEALKTCKKVHLGVAWEELEEVVEGVYLMGSLTLYEGETPLVSYSSPYMFYRNIEDDWAVEDLLTELLYALKACSAKFLEYNEPYKGALK